MKINNHTVQVILRKRVVEIMCKESDNPSGH